MCLALQCPQGGSPRAGLAWPCVPTVLRNSEVSASVRPRGLEVSGSPRKLRSSGCWAWPCPCCPAPSLCPSCSFPGGWAHPWLLDSAGNASLGQHHRCLVLLLSRAVSGIALVGSLPLSQQFSLGSSRSSLSSCCTARIAPPAPEGVTGCPCPPLLEPPQPCWKHLWSRIPVFSWCVSRGIAEFLYINHLLSVFPWRCFSQSCLPGIAGPFLLEFFFPPPG